MTTKPPIIAPSILAADFTKLAEQIQACVQAGTNWIHCDIMDGHFVPNISFGPMIVEAAGRSDDVFLDVHCMIENPGQYVDAFANAGAGLITVHQEVCPHLHRTIQQIKEQDIKAGVALNPATSLHHITPILPYIDMVLIMSVNPGFGGQSFIEATYQRIERMQSLREQCKSDFLIEVDGGINPENIEDIARAGADVFVAGSSVFKSGDIKQQIKKLSGNACPDEDLYV